MLDMVLMGVLALLVLLSLILLLRLRKLETVAGQSEAETHMIRLDARLQALADSATTQEKTIREELHRNREELSKSLHMMGERLAKLNDEQQKSQADLREKMDKKIGELQTGLRDKLDQRLTELQTGNEKKLDEMRRTVDEHLQTALEKKITESFKTVADRLEAVQKGLGEMQSLASGVGDLKRVLTNVKSRGIVGEIQLEALISDILSAEQYVKNFHCGKNGGENVEFAVRLPGSEPALYLPVDAKFPTEDYDRLIAASDAGDRLAVEEAGVQLERRIRRFAKDMADKYINPPTTTDYALLFLPTEGLYAEILRRHGLFEALQRDFRVTVAGPTTLQVLLSTFRLGYRQVAMSERAMSVLEILGAVRSEFVKYGDQISSMAKSIDAARNHVEKLGTRRNVMLRALRNVEEVSDERVAELLPFEESAG